MEIIHRDRNGQFWRFEIDCTNEQGQIIRDALAAVRNMGGRRALRISALLEESKHPAPFAEVEVAMLRGLAAAFPAPVLSVPRPAQEPAAPVMFVADDEPAPAYWWNRD